MALLTGHKLWRLWPREDAALLYPASREGSRDVVFEADPLADHPPPAHPPAHPPTASPLASPFSPSSQQRLHPAAGLARPWEVVLEGGDLLFVPCDCPHFVANLDDTVAISANFVDPPSNGARAAAALEEEALSDAGAGRAVAAAVATAVVTAVTAAPPPAPPSPGEPVPAPMPVPFPGGPEVGAAALMQVGAPELEDTPYAVLAQGP